MNRLIKISMMVMVAVGAIALNSSIARADFPFNHMSNEACVVTNELWEFGSANPDHLKLPTALQRANLPVGSQNPACAHDISILQDMVIAVGGAFTIKAPAGSDNIPFVLQGGCVSDSNNNGVCDGDNYAGVSVLDLSKVSASSGCAITINGTGAIKLKNLVIKGAQANVTSVCVESKSVTLENVRVESAGGDAIVVGATASSFKLDATSSLKDISGRGVVFNNPNITSNNFIETYDSQINTLLGTDGFLKLDPLGNYFSMQSVGTDDPESWISSAVPIYVKLIKKELIGDKILMQGFVVTGATTETEGEAVDLCEKEATTKATGIQVYDIGGLDSQYNAVTGGLVGTIGEKKGLGLNPSTGFFQVYLPINADDSRMFFLVPQVNNGALGKPSVLLSMSNDKGAEVECPNRAFNSTGFTAQNEDPTSIGYYKGYVSEDECLEKRGLKEGGMVATSDLCLNEKQDTDGDGLLDREEDKNCNCDVDDDETNWHEFDSDSDGIPDGFGSEKMSINSDCDDKANARDPDSDNDGLGDGAEDRNQTFIKNIGTKDVKGVLYRFRQGSNNSAPEMKDGEALECELGTNNKVGVAYLWYVVHCDDDKCSSISNLRYIKSGFGTSGEIVEGDRLEVMVCRNLSLGSSRNFNGEVDDTTNNEFNPWSADTDNDGLCDGTTGECVERNIQVMGCPITKTFKKGDKCPNFSDTDNSCADAPKCFDGDIFWTVDPKFVNWSSMDGSPESFVDVIGWNGATGADQVPDFLQQGSKLAIESACPVHSDEDGIPDCVEYPYTVCGEEGLKYWDADSDGDKINDGIDVCPETAGPDGQDSFVEGKAIDQYSCKGNAKMIFANNQNKRALAFFMDRDGDSLFDAEEDKGLDGKGFDGTDSTPTPITAEKLAAIETNPLMRDSDGDGLTDDVEVNTIIQSTAFGVTYTNPRNKNTDDDGLDDAREDADGTIGYNIGQIDMPGSEGCTGAFDVVTGAPKVDTDPNDPDTDRDGIQDGIEVSGYLMAGTEFLAAISDMNTFTKGVGGVNVVSNPRSSDSDGDTIPDAAEYYDIVKWNNSNPCMSNSDGDDTEDIAELAGCALNKDPNCKENKNTLDMDGDGLSNECEKRLGTNPIIPDTDGDGLWDGVEDADKSCKYEESNHDETDPINPDSDSDGISDGMERNYDGGVMDPRNADSDNDCLKDSQEDANHDGRYNAGSETNAADADTDKDGLPDGWLGSVGLGEDINCNGVRDTDANGNYSETDPMNADSDQDGQGDGSELGGIMANRSNALNREGCSMVGVTGGAPSSMFFLMMMLVGLTKVVSRKMKTSA